MKSRKQQQAKKKATKIAPKASSKSTAVSAASAGKRNAGRHREAPAKWTKPQESNGSIKKNRQSLSKTPAKAPGQKYKTVARTFSRPDQPQFTGKQLVVLNPGRSVSDFQRVAKSSSIKLASIADYSGSSTQSNYHMAMDEADGVIFNQLKIAVVNQNHEAVNRLTTASVSKSNFLLSEPERYVYATQSRIGTRKVTRKLSARDISLYSDSATATWGIQAINALSSKYSGNGIKLAILDTGFTLDHPDFVGRSLVSKSFIDSETVDDGNGHGTHCTGIATGGISKSNGYRYGTAQAASIFIGKVLDNEGQGTDGSILAGIEWALENGCQIVSMSLGGPVKKGDAYSQVYESAAKQALKNNCLLIAAAGNESRRDAVVSPVDHPANCPSIMAIAALDDQLKIASFSCAGLNANGGQVDLAAPGVDILSAWKDGKYYSDSGTSMATPFVAGIAALLWEANPGASASDIWMKLSQSAKRLNISSVDAGAGLAFIP